MKKVWESKKILINSNCFKIRAGAGRIRWERCQQVGCRAAIPCPPKHALALPVHFADYHLYDVVSLFCSKGSPGSGTC